MGGKMTKLIPGLFVGNLRNAFSETELKLNKITHILSITDAKREIPQSESRKYLKILLPDSPHARINDHFSQAIKFIHDARMSGGVCLVHCLAGASRSVTICVAYIITLTNLPFQQALDSVRGLRPVADPNFGFQRQLRDFQDSSRTLEERQQLETSFGVWEHLDADLALLNEGLCKFNELKSENSVTLKSHTYYRNLPSTSSINDPTEQKTSSGSSNSTNGVSK